MEGLAALVVVVDVQLVKGAAVTKPSAVHEDGGLPPMAAEYATRAEAKR